MWSSPWRRCWDRDAPRLECFRLSEGSYAFRADGIGDEVVGVSDFPGLRVPLATLWFGKAFSSPAE
jgi:hypothetical protein